MKRNQKNGFSLLEVIAAVFILAVVTAATIATIAPMRQKSEDKLAIGDIASLNAVAETYYLEKGSYPPSISHLARQGYLANSTPAERMRYEKLAQYTYDRKTGSFTRPETP